MKLSALFQSNFITISLIIVSLLCLYPGLTEPIMSLRIAVTLPIIGDMEFYNKTQSIWSSILSLYESDYTFVAFLIFLLSIAVPFLSCLP